MAESCQNGSKILWEKEKLLVTSNFSFSHSVFKRLILQTHKKPGLVWEWVNYPSCVLMINPLEMLASKKIMSIRKKNIISAFSNTISNL